MADVLRPSRCELHRKPAQNSQREGRSLPRQGRDHLFQWDVGISVGFLSETTGPLQNIARPGVPRHMYPPTVLFVEKN